MSEPLRDSSAGVAYVMFWIFVFAALLPSAPAARIALSVLSVTCLLEFAQLWHPAWLEAVRGHFLGRALLGTTFEWSDFPPYFLGSLLGWATLRILHLSSAGPVSATKRGQTE